MCLSDGWCHISTKSLHVSDRHVFTGRLLVVLIYKNTKSLMKPRIDTFPLFIVCAEYTRCIGIFSNIVSSLYYNDVSFLHGYRAGIIVLCIFEVKNYFNRRHLSGGGRVRNAGLPVITGNTLLPVACEYCRRAPSDSWVQPPILTISSNLAIVAKLGDPKCL